MCCTKSIPLLLQRPQETVLLEKVQPCPWPKERDEAKSSDPLGSGAEVAGSTRAGHRPVTRSMSGEKAESRLR